VMINYVGAKLSSERALVLPDYDLYAYTKV
jgi:hypothetical protein